jgi:hypothetical protein
MLKQSEIVIQILMEATNGLGVILENRYYGDSFPFNDSSTDHLAFLTTEQSSSSTFLYYSPLFLTIVQQPSRTMHTSPKMQTSQV